MTTIYLVTEVEYSDYHVCAVFSTYALAHDYMDKFHGEDIEEYKLDPVVQTLPNGMNVYNLDMLRDGDTNYMRYVDTPQLDALVEPHLDYSFWKNGALTGDILARDKKHAVKIFNEKRTQLIAEGTWK
jgi:hypothetical protein